MEPYIIVGILTPLTLWIFAVGFWLTWRWAPDMKQSRTLAICYSLLGAAFSVPVVFLNYSAPLGFLLCGAFALSGAVFMAHGIFQRFGKMAPLKTLISLLVLNVSLDVYTLLILNNPGLSLRISSIVAGTMLLVLGLSINSLERRTPLEKMVPLAVGSLGILVVAHPVFVYSIHTQAMTFSNFANSVDWISMNIIVLLLGVVTAMTLMSMIVNDITNQLRRRAEIDSLSGLPRRGVFEADAAMILHRADRSPLPITMITCDIDNFKSINDRFGHIAGDAVIARLGQLLNGVVRKTDSVGRMGGEEFAVLMWNANAKSGRLMAEQIRLAFEQTEYEGLLEGHRCTASFGVAQFEKGETFKSLFTRADRALYAAKDSGRNRVTSFETSALAA